MQRRTATFVTLVAAVSAAFPCTRASAAKKSLSPAEEHIEAGLELRRRGRDDTALAEFQRAYGLDPSPRASAQLGLCEQALGSWVDANQHISDALGARQDPWVLKNQTVLESSLRTVKEHLGTVRVNGGPAGAHVFVSGRAAGQLPLENPIPVNAGSVEIVGEAPGYRRESVTVTVEGGRFQDVALNLQREVPLAPTAHQPQTAAEQTLTPQTAVAMNADEPAQEGSSRSLFSRPTFWIVVGTLLAAGVASAIVLSSGSSTPKSDYKGPFPGSGP